MIRFGEEQKASPARGRKRKSGIPTATPISKKKSRPKRTSAEDRRPKTAVRARVKKATSTTPALPELEQKTSTAYRAAQRRTGSTVKSEQGMLVFAVVSVAFLLVATVVVLIHKNGNSSPPPMAIAEPASPQPVARKQVPRTTSARQKPLARPKFTPDEEFKRQREAVRRVSLEQRRLARERENARVASTQQIKPIPKVATAATESSEPTPANVAVPVGKQTSARKYPLPSAAEQQQIMHQLREIGDPANATTLEEKQELTKRLLRLAKESEGGPTEKFVLLRAAAKSAGNMGDAVLMLKIVDVMAADYELDPIAAKATLLTNFATDAKETDEIGSLVAASGSFVDDALRARRHDLALSNVALVYNTCQRTNGKPYRKEAFDRRREVELRCESHQRSEDALAQLRANPEDPNANLLVGRSICFDDGDWSAGLLHLSLGSDPVLAAAARLELLSPVDPTKQVQVADAWWKAAETEQGRVKTVFQRHAAVWYRHARAKLAPGLLKAKVDQRLAEMAVSDAGT